MRRKVLWLVAIVSLPFLVMYIAVVTETDALLSVGGGLMLILGVLATFAHLSGLEVD